MQSGERVENKLGTWTIKAQAGERQSMPYFIIFFIALTDIKRNNLLDLIPLYWIMPCHPRGWKEDITNKTQPGQIKTPHRL